MWRLRLAYFFGAEPGRACEALWLCRRAEPVAIAILAKAPVAGLAKTPADPGPRRARRGRAAGGLTERAVETALAARIGPVTLWATPDATHPSFRELAVRSRHRVKRQPEGDLGARMLAACEGAGGPALVIGTDCPALIASASASGRGRAARRDTTSSVIPAEDGGYVLIGMRKPQPVLFGAMPWRTDRVMAETRAAHVPKTACGAWSIPRFGTSTGPRTSKGCAAIRLSRASSSRRTRQGLVRAVPPARD